MLPVTTPTAIVTTLPALAGRGVEEGKAPGLKLFHTMNGNVAEVVPRCAEVEADVQHLIEAHMETMLGVRFLASEYGTGPVHGGRIDSLGLDENDALLPSGALVASGIRSPR